MIITETQIKARAKRHGLALRKDRRTGDFSLVDLWGNYLAAPGPLTLTEAALWLDDLDKLDGQEGET